jgi:predicted HicB family RNase H-like nuclease
LFSGKVIGIQSLISYEGKTGKELKKDFQEAIDEYLEACKINGST